MLSAAPPQHTPNVITATERGVYVCAACDTALFASTHALPSPTLIFSFDAELHDGAVRYHSTHEHGLDRIDVYCDACGAHVGNVFVNEPTPTGKRFCVLEHKVRFQPTYE